MKVLLDSNIGLRVRHGLQAAGHDVEHVTGRDTDPGDLAILARAFDEQRVLVTQDADFGLLAIALRREHAGISAISCWVSANH